MFVRGLVFLHESAHWINCGEKFRHQTEAFTTREAAVKFWAALSQFIASGPTKEKARTPLAFGLLEVLLSFFLELVTHTNDCDFLVIATGRIAKVGD